MTPGNCDRQRRSRPPAARVPTAVPAGPMPPARFSAQARLRALQADIMELILERELEAGDALPTENELSAALGVGRNTLRESLKVLQALGVIEIRHGFGMFVAPSNFDALADGLTFRGRLSLRHHGQEALQLVDVRQALEAGLIAGRHGPDDAGAPAGRRGIRAPDGGTGRRRRETSSKRTPSSTAGCSNP